VKTNTARMMVMAGALTGGAAAIYAGLRKALGRTAARQEMLEREVLSLSATVAMLEAKLAAMHKPVAAPPVAQVSAAGATLPALAAEADRADARLEGVEPEMVRVLVAAAAAALGRNVRLISARLVPAIVDSPSPWSQQGRVFVHTSHNLR